MNQFAIYLPNLESFVVACRDNYLTARTADRPDNFSSMPYQCCLQSSIRLPKFDIIVIGSSHNCLTVGTETRESQGTGLTLQAAAFPKVVNCLFEGDRRSHLNI